MSQRKVGAAERRDVRSAKDGQETAPSSPSRKDKKSWCRGKVGTPHKPSCRDYAEVKNQVGMRERFPSLYDGWKLLVCTACGKELAYYYPMRDRAGTPPDWVK